MWSRDADRIRREWANCVSECWLCAQNSRFHSQIFGIRQGNGVKKTLARWKFREEIEPYAFRTRTAIPMQMLRVMDSGWELFMVLAWGEVAYTIGPTIVDAIRQPLKESERKPSSKTETDTEIKAVTTILTIPRGNVRVFVFVARKTTFKEDLAEIFSEFSHRVGKSIRNHLCKRIRWGPKKWRSETQRPRSLSNMQRIFLLFDSGNNCNLIGPKGRENAAKRKNTVILGKQCWQMGNGKRSMHMQVSVLIVLSCFCYSARSVVTLHLCGPRPWGKCSHINLSWWNMSHSYCLPFVVCPQNKLHRKSNEFSTF